MRFRILQLLAAAAFAAAGFPTSSDAVNVKRLTLQEDILRKSVLESLEPLISEKKKDGSAVLLTWEALYASLSAEQRSFLDEFRQLRAEKLGATSHYFGEAIPDDLLGVGTQLVKKEGVPTPLDPQYLPKAAFEAYQRLITAMAIDLKKRLLVESGYRSPAYQLYLFLFYMQNHDFSVIETNRHVALPGHSEHGAPQHQAIDFINEESINGEYHPEEFEALPEYAWLSQHANQYGFFLSYPRNNALNTAFEPWHWHYEAARDLKKPQSE